jgi:hypothetical protein
LVTTRSTFHRGTNQGNQDDRGGYSQKPDIDSPVYRFIARLTPPALKAEIREAINDASQAAAALSPSGSPATAATPAHSEMMSRVNEAQRKEDWLTKVLLEQIRAMRNDRRRLEVLPWGEDPYIIQRLALATYKSKHPTPEQAFQDGAISSACSIQKFQMTRRRWACGVRFTSGCGQNKEPQLSRPGYSWL